MGHPSSYQPHKLFVAVLARPGIAVETIRDVVGEGFGEIDVALEPRPFRFSSYYDAEMGTGLTRTLLGIRTLVDPEDLATLKKRSDTIESRLVDANGNRALNLDPGLLSLSRVILATTKASAHRIPLRDGYFAEITLIYRYKRYAPLEWTYPDFRSDEFVDWLGSLRTRYHAQLREIDAKRAWRL